MFRITSDLLTAYTHDDYMPFYFQPDVVQFLESNLSKIVALMMGSGVSPRDRSQSKVSIKKGMLR